MSGGCNCGHGPHVHVRFVGGCGLCGCPYFVRAYHDGCRCFVGGEAGEWWHETPGATESHENGSGDPTTARTPGARALGGKDGTTEGEEA